jgi:hypothetical protein
MLSDNMSSMPAQNGLAKDQIDIIWQMGVASLASNHNELIIPKFMASLLNQINIEDLKSRLR